MCIEHVHRSRVSEGFQQYENIIVIVVGFQKIYIDCAHQIFMPSTRILYCLAVLMMYGYVMLWNENLTNVEAVTPIRTFHLLSFCNSDSDKKKKKTALHERK